MRHALAVVVALAALAGPVTAAPVFYTSRAAFNAAAGGGLKFESFEVAFPAPGYAPTYTFDGFTISEISGINALTNVLNNNLFPGSAPVTDGRGAIWYDDNGASIGVFQFDFGAPLTALGMDITTSANSTVTVGGDLSASLNLTALTPQFFGVIDTAGTFDRITFDASGGPNVGFDAVAFAPVPEPATLSLLALGGLGLLRRRRKTRDA